MKEINIKCPHCAKAFDLAAMLSVEVRSALVKELGPPGAERSVQDAALMQMGEEYEKHLSELRGTILELQRKVAPSSHQRAGETFEADVSTVTGLHDQVEREKQFFERHWAERLKLAASIRQSISTVARGLDGVTMREGQCIQRRTITEPKKLETADYGKLIDRE